MSKNIQTIGINFRDGNGSGGNFGGGSSYQQEERKEAVQTTVPYNPPTFLGNNNMVQPYQSNLGTTGSMFGSSGGGYVGVAEYNYTRSNPHVGIGVHNWIPPELEQIQSIQTVTNLTQSVVTNLTPPIVKTKPVETIKERDLRYAIGTAADVKAKAITEMIIATQEEGSQKTLNLEYMLNREDACTLGYALTKVSFDLDVMSLKNINLDRGIDYFLGIFRNNLNEGVFHNVTYLDLSNTTYGASCLAYQVSHCLTSGGLKATKAINLSGNRLNDAQVKSQLVGALKDEKVTNLEYLNLSNNKITDEGASAIAEALESGKVNNLQKLDVSGNKITEVGQDFFVRALNDPIVKRLAILIDDLSHNLRIQSGIKEDVVAELHDILKSAKNRGVDVDNLVVDTSFLTWVKNIKGAITVAKNGFIKCNWIDDPIGDYAKADLCAKLPDKIGKSLKKAIDIEGIVSCFIYAYDQAKTSEFGAQMAITDLHVIGEDYIPENID